MWIEIWRGFHLTSKVFINVRLDQFSSMNYFLAFKHSNWFSKWVSHRLIFEDLPKIGKLAQIYLKFVNTMWIINKWCQFTNVIKNMRHILCRICNVLSISLSLICKLSVTFDYILLHRSCVTYHAIHFASSVFIVRDIFKWTFWSQYSLLIFS